MKMVLTTEEWQENGLSTEEKQENGFSSSSKTNFMKLQCTLL
jgi:hypothetical protein